MLPANRLLELLHLADSALPIGAAAHSFGLETLVEDETVTPETLETFFREQLRESGVLEAGFVRRAWRGDDLIVLSQEFEARRPARESREASFKMGRRFTDLFHALSGIRLPAGLHYPIAFGAACAAVEIPQEAAIAAYLQQSLMGLISACQRLMPVGQVAANRMLWNLREPMLEAVRISETLEVACFTPLPELGSMRHSSIETRLFIS